MIYSDTTGENETIGVQIALNEGQKCKSGKPQQHYHLTWRVFCNDELKRGVIQIKSHDLTIDKCDFVIEAESLHGCQMANYYVLSSFIQNFKIIFFVAFILIGSFLNFLGAKIVKCTLVITSFFVTVGGIFFLLFSVIGLKSLSMTVMWILLILTLLISFLVAYLFLKFIKVFYAVLGGIMGYAIGSIVYSFIFRHITSNPELFYWLSIIICVILGVLFAVFAHKHLTIVATSILGSYIFIRGISLLAGGFPSEAEMIDLISRKEFDQLSDLLTPLVYLYFAGLAILIVCGIVVQYKFYSEDDEKKLDSREVALNN